MENTQIIYCYPGSNLCLLLKKKNARVHQSTRQSQTKLSLRKPGNEGETDTGNVSETVEKLWLRC